MTANANTQSRNDNPQPAPTYQTLFGSGNYYTVDPARSVLSPAAYLVDLLNLIQSNIPVSDNDSSFQTRRGDIFSLPLNKENTDNELPKIQIVNQVLANYLSGVSTPLSQAQCPTDLSTQVAPFALPYNQALDQIRHYLAQNGTSLAEIWKSLIPKASLTTDQIQAIQLETLGISNEQWTQYSNPASVNTINSLYGLNLTAGSNGTLSTTFITPPITVDAFLSATGLNYDLLMELLYQDLSEKELGAPPSPAAGFYINTGPNSESTGTVSIENQALQNLSAYTLDRIQRFVRLAKAIGWSFTDLDWALQTIGEGINSGSPSISISLPYLAWMQDLIKNNGLSVNQCCAIIGTLKDYGRKNGKLTFFDHVFNNPNNPNFTWSASPTPSWIVGQSGQPVQSALAAALQVSEDNLTSIGNLILQSQPSSTNQISLTNHNLAILYRLSLLPEMTGLSFKESLVAVNLIAQSQNIAQAVNSTSASGITYAIDALIDFTGWLKKSPFSIYELQFILTGQSSDAATQNKILGTDSITNFLQDLTASIEKTLLTERVFYNDTKTSLQSLYAELVPNIIPALQASTIGNLTTSTALDQMVADANLVAALSSTFSSLPYPTTSDISTILTNSTDVQTIIQNESLLNELQTLFPQTTLSSATAIGTLAIPTALDQIVADANLVAALSSTFSSLPYPTTSDISTILTSSTDVQTIIQNESLLTDLQNLFPKENIASDYVQRWVNQFFYAHVQSHVQSISENIYAALVPACIDNNSVVLTSTTDNSALQDFIENSLLSVINSEAGLNITADDMQSVWLVVSTADLITAITTTLVKYYQLQQKTFIQHLSSLYKLSSQTGALLKEIGDLNIEALIGGELSASTPHLLSGLITSQAGSPLQYDLQQSIIALQKLQQTAELIRIISLSPAEVEYFKPAISYSAQQAASGISIETVKSMLLLKELVTGFQDAQNNLLDVLNVNFLTASSIQCLAMGTSLLYAGTAQGLYYRETNGNWVLLNNTVPADANIQCLQYNSGTLYVGTANGLYTGNGGNTGSWIKATFPNSISPNVQCLSMYTPVSGQMAIGTSSGLYFCNTGSNAMLVSSASVNGLPQDANIQCLAMGTSRQYAGTTQGLYYRETDGNWVLLNKTVPADANIQCLQYNGSLYVGTANGLYTGSGGNSGSWVKVTFPNSISPNVQCLSMFTLVPGQMTIGTSSGLYFFNKGSNNSILVSSASVNGLPQYANIQCLAMGTSRQYAGTTQGLYYRETDGNWVLLNKTVPADANIQCLQYNSGTLYVGTANGLYANGLYAVTKGQLANLSSCSEHQIQKLMDNFVSSSWFSSTDFTVAKVALLKKYFDTAESLGVDTDTLWDFVQLPALTSSSTPTNTQSESNIAQALWGGLQALYKNQPTVLAKIQGILNEKLRNKLVPIAMQQLGVSTPRELYEYLLVDVEVSANVQTSYVREAISAVQLYIYRCLNQLEPAATINPSFSTLWGWMYAYREWQANKEVFLYPENYIEPELRLDKTDLFSMAEHAMHQADLSNPENVENIFRDYMNGLEEIGNLQIISCAAHTYQAEDAEGMQSFKELCMIGNDSTVPGRYYYRLAKFRESTSQNQYVPHDWGQWKKITIVMNTVEYQLGQYGIPKPVHAFGRWYIFWVEQKKNNTSTEQSTNNTYEYYTGEVKFTHLDFNNNWNAAKRFLEVDFNSSNTSITNIIPVVSTNSDTSAQTTAYKISTEDKAEVLADYDEVNTILVIAAFGRIYYRSQTEGNLVTSGSWQSAIGLGASSGLLAEVDIQCLTTDGLGNWLAGTSSGLYYASVGLNEYGSANPISSGTWQPVTAATSNGLSPTAIIQCLANNSISVWLAGTSSGLYFASVDTNPISSGTWQRVAAAASNGLSPTASIQCLTTDIWGNWLAGTSSGLYFASTGVHIFSNTTTWQLVAAATSNGLPSTASIQCLTNDNSGNWLAGTSSGLYYASVGPNSVSSGTWQRVAAAASNGLSPTASIQCLTSDRLGNWLAGTSSGLYFASTGGAANNLSNTTTWQLVTAASSNGLPSTASIQCLTTDWRGNWLAGTSSGLYFASTEGGSINLSNTTTWQLVTAASSNGLPSTASIQCLTTDWRGNWLAGTSSGLYFTSTEGGSNNLSNTTTWQLVTAASSNGLSPTASIQCLATNANGNFLASGSFGSYLINISTNFLSVTLAPLLYNSIQPFISPTNVYLTSAVSILIQGEPNWFIVNGQNDQYLNISCPPGDSPTSFNVYRLNSTAIPSLGVLLNTPNGIKSLLSFSAQQSPEQPFSNLQPDASYFSDANTPSDQIDFSLMEGMSNYYWELFFHLPFLIANELKTHQHFAEAKKWLQYIFNPEILAQNVNLSPDDSDANDQYWQFLGLRSFSNTVLEQELSQTALQQEWSDMTNNRQLFEIKKDPFDPQAIANLRPIAYQKTIVMHYIDNLLNWGDMLYRENTRDSINEAEMLYVLAYNLLGVQPQDLGPYKLTPNCSYSNQFGFRCMIDGLIGTDNGLYYLDSTTSSWLLVPTQVLKNVAITCLISDGQSTPTYYAGTKENGLFSSPDKQNWENVSDVPATANVICMFFGTCSGNFLQLIGTENGMYKIDSQGNVTKSTTFQNYAINCIIPAQGFLFAGTSQGSYAYDGNWSGGSSAPYYDITCMGFGNNYLDIYGTVSNGLLLKIEGQTAPQPAPGWLNTACTITCIYNDTQGSDFYVGTKGLGLFYSGDSDNPSSWAQVAYTGSTMGSLTINCMLRQSSGNLYAGTNQGLYYMDGSNNNTWTLVSQPNLSIANIQFLYQDNENNLFVASGQGLWQLSAANASGSDFHQISHSFLNRSLGIPRNQQFLDYWDEVKQRIYNIRQGLTINGQTDNLPLFSPPINPMDLVEAVGSGEGVAEAVQAMNTTIPYYRFEVMIEKAKEVTDTVVQFGQSLLTALQTKDAQKLAELYNKNERHLLSVTQTAKQDNLSYAQQNVQSLQQALAAALARQTYYASLIQLGLSPAEVSQLTLANDAITAQSVAEFIQLAAIIGYCIPNIFGLADGGFQIGNAISQGAEIVEGIGNILNQQAGLAATSAGYQRRSQDWQLKAQLAQDDINQIKYQKVAAQYQEDLATQEINILLKQIDQQQKVAQFYKTKFTNDQLYNWYIGELSGLYFQAYRLAHDMALQAENAWKFEHIGFSFSNQKDNFIKSGYWNSLYEGLLAGESLQLDLQRMEKAYMDQNVRRFEIKKTISLAQLDPVALFQLVTTGTCQFDITENDFAWDYPGHYCRKIKTVSVSIPMVVGPYQNVHAMLTQTSSKIVNSDGSDGQNAVQYLLNPYSSGNQSGTKLSAGSTALQSNLIPNQQIALSQGVNDTGLFELNFNDARYLPFEGTGAVSSWLLEMPLEENSINFESITDVIIEMNYTALQGSSAYKTAVTAARGNFNGTQVISLAQAFPSAWLGFTDVTSIPLTFSLNTSRWRGVGNQNAIVITAITAYAQVSENGSMAGCELQLEYDGSNPEILQNWSNNIASLSSLNLGPTQLRNKCSLTLTSGALPTNSTTNAVLLTNLILIVDYTVQPAS